MKKLLFASLLLLFGSSVFAQFQVELEEIIIANSPGVQSFVHAEYDGKWLILGGRTDGLHQRQPFAAFLPADNNVQAYVVDPNANTTWAVSLAALPFGLYEQLQSTNMQFEQRDSTLYVIGGYGFSTSSNDHITYPYLTAINVPGLMDAIMNNGSLPPNFRQLTDTRMQVTGGYLDRLGDTFFLAGGQLFEGRYNPMGPTHGPGFVQEYTDAIRQFEIVDDGTNLQLANYSTWQDSANLHRRDYNMAVQRFPDGEIGFTMFSGVFQHNVDLPWLNTVDVRSSGYTVRNGFEQHLNQYHTAHMAVFDSTENQMHTVFFGGMSRYTLDAQGQLVDDQDVPFVRTISQVTRFGNDSMAEYQIGEMPALLGSGAEFIPVSNASFVDGYEMIQLSQLPEGRHLVGYIVGGIESTAPNIFFINDGTQSDATNRVFEVYINTAPTAAPQPITGKEFFNAQLFPNPAHSATALVLKCPHVANVQIDLLNQRGQLLRELYSDQTEQLSLPLVTSDLESGQYFVRVRTKQFARLLPLIVQ